MIHSLRIENLAIVQELNIEFETGFNVLTGETGAGKSIIIGALELLVGRRATSNLVRTGCEKAIVEATVEFADEGISTVRREISVHGRSRILVNRELSTSATLKELGRALVDIHGQHAHQSLLDAQTHIGLLDTYAKLQAAVKSVGEHFKIWRSAKENLEKFRHGRHEKERHLELIRFQLDEIERIAPQEREDEKLGSERNLLANAEKVELLCRETYGVLYEDEDSILSRFGRVRRNLEELSVIDEATFQPYTDTEGTIVPTLEDLATFLRSHAATVESSPLRLAEVESRLAELEGLKKKYGPNLGDVLLHRTKLVDDLGESGSEGVDEKTFTGRVEEASQAFRKDALELSEVRTREAARLGGRLGEVLAELAIPYGRIEVQVRQETTTDRWSENGVDCVEIFFSANPGESLRPLVDVASGGELSRVMLGLKTLVSNDSPGKTLLFDEVDAGIGGAAAECVGIRLRRLGQRFQVLCVTHSPQIAALASTHFSVSKTVADGRTNAVLKRLDASGREQELARMMTGGTTKAALKSAREMLEF